ncbi:MAG: gamma-glutamyl-gamma-aminobutyrate hydrolase family protein [Gammaproteobacteria bacterium]|nr:gamma-glutamyl-gamma-aminobutyrate hydrolase family protein [Gammaproteobacteria bacterium]MDH5693139.1 gamma-glutamyl-gamma-aminobutyrate hydrolase family protein [Gammaproteobacteria bacterium]
MRIGILQCDSIMDEYRSQFENYPEMFRTLLGTQDPTIEFETFDVEHGHYPPTVDRCDGYVITGSKASVYENEDWIRRFGDYLRVLHESRTPVVGICFGHQLLAQALGGKTEKSSKGWGVGIHTSLVVQKKEWQQPPLQKMSILVSHQDQVVQLPKDAELIVSSEFCPNGGFQIGSHILSFQGHPEFTKPYSQTMMNHRREKLGEEVYQKGVTSLNQEIDSPLIARWIISFFVQALAKKGQPE